MKLFSQIVQANLFSEWNALMCFLMLGYSLKVFSQCGQVKYHFLYVHKYDLWGLKPVQTLVSILGSHKEHQVGHAFWYVLLEHYLLKIVCHNQYTQEVLYRFLHGQPHVFSVSHQLQRFCSKSHIYELALTVSLNSHLITKWGIHVLLHARQALTMCHTVLFTFVTRKKVLQMYSGDHPDVLLLSLKLFLELQANSLGMEGRSSSFSFFTFCFGFMNLLSFIFRSLLSGCTFYLLRNHQDLSIWK